MALRSGYPTQHIIQLTVRSPWLGDIATDSSNIWPPSCHSIAYSHNGGKKAKHRRNVQNGARIRSGYNVNSYKDDFYERIHVKPAFIEFGVVVGDTSVDVDVWNAYTRGNAMVDTVMYDRSMGLEINGEPIPTTILPLGEVRYEVTALAQGPALISGSLLWVFSVPEPVGYLPAQFNMPVNGTRVRMLGIEPAWPPTGQSYRIKHSYRTSMITSRSGREQRIALRDTPRKFVDFVTHLSGEAFVRFKDQMWFWQHLPFAIPELTRNTSTTTRMLPGEDFLDVAEVPEWLVPGAQLILSYHGQQDIIVVNTIENSTLRFKTKGAALWPIGTTVYPGLTGTISASTSVPRLTNAVATATVAFEVTPLSEPRVPVPVAPDTFSGRELFLKKPNWAGQVQGTFMHETDVLDYGRGPVSRVTPVPFTADLRRATFLNRNYEEAQLLLDFFNRMKGQQGEFFQPTWEYDFKPFGVQTSGSYGFLVAGTMFASVFARSTAHRSIFVVTLDGALHCRNVLSINEVTDSAGTNSLMTLDEPWTEDISTDKIVMSGWLLVNRLASDDITFEWLTDRVANVQMSTVSLENLPAEI